MMGPCCFAPAMASCACSRVTYTSASGRRADRGCAIASGEATGGLPGRAQPPTVTVPSIPGWNVQWYG
jgi:hypothetical protein